jgi:hypothetical protein
MDLGGRGGDGEGRRRTASAEAAKEGTYTQKQSRAGPTRGAQLAGNGQWRFCSVALAETCSAACRGLVRRYRCEEVKHLPPREGEVTELQHHGGREGGGEEQKDWENCVTALMLSVRSFRPPLHYSCVLWLLCCGWSPGLHCEREHRHRFFIGRRKNNQCCRLLLP